MKQHLVRPGEKVSLADIDPRDKGPHKGKADAVDDLRAAHEQLVELQKVLYAEARRGLLIVLQAMDTGGKDGTIRAVMSGVNPQGCYVTSFKAPSQEELAHDYLWRVHARVPRRGMIGIFNRSHYEDVLIVRVHGLVPPEVWRKRYDQINHFERYLAENDITIIKFFLHISREEQKKRLQARLDDPSKHWKFSVDDLPERERWDDYQKAYEDMLNRTSTEWAPWHVVPADRKWYRNVVVNHTIAETLRRMDPRYPRNDIDPATIVIPD